jgi:hypothetical protein
MRSVGVTLVRIALILATTGAGVLWLIHKGPVPVVRITTPLPEMAPFWYMLLAFPVLGMLVADWVDLARLRGMDLATVELGAQIALIVGLSAVRLDSRIPLSGHALLIAYFLLRRLWLRNMPPPQSRLEVWLAAGALGGVAYPKLMWWDDPVTLLTGIGVAGGLAAVSGWVGRRQDDC